MKISTVVLIAGLCFLAAAPVRAQRAPATPSAPAAPAAPATPSQRGRSTPPPPPPAPPNPAAAPISDAEAGGQPVNIRLEVSVTDQTGAGAAQPKTLTVLLADRAMSRTRSSFEDRTIDIDARPLIVAGRIRLFITIASNSLRSPATMPTAADSIKEWRNSFTLLLESGKPEMAVESSDPAKGRKTSVEVKATILK